MSIESDLYQELILEHYRSQEYRGEFDDGWSAVGDNPACGDFVTLYARQADGGIHYRFSGAGCAICCASASLLCESLAGDDVGVAHATYDDFKALIMKQRQVAFDDKRSDLEALQGVRDYPMRVKCVLLPWEALSVIIKQIHKEMQ